MEIRLDHHGHWNCRLLKNDLEVVVMRCPICGGRAKVLDVREKRDKVKRRRECPDCLTRFTTEEKLVMESLDEYLIRRLNHNFRTL